MGIKKKCIFCGKVCIVTPSRAKTFKYCSNECRNNHKKKNLKKHKKNAICQYCGKKYYINPSLLDSSKYCSKKCHSNSMKKSVIKYCNYCGKKYYVKPSKSKTSKYCSQECRNKDNEIIKKCLNCGKKYVVSPSRIDSKYCSLSCSNNSLLRTKNIHKAKKKNNSYGKSKEEDLLYKYLCIEFGKNNVKRQVYRGGHFFDFAIQRTSPKINYAKEHGLNLSDFKYEQLIEYNGLYYHNYRPFRKNDDYHEEEFNKMLKMKGQYKGIAEKWKINDVRKKEFCKNNNLNYISIYGWFGTNHFLDKKQEYTDIQLRNELENFKNIKNKKINYTIEPNLSKIIKTFSWNELYKNILDDFTKEEIFEFYVNRIKFRTFDSIINHNNGKEIKGNFGKGIATIGRFGLLSMYSKLMKPNLSMSLHSGNNIRRFIKDYDLKHIYDPCAGWGHRMIGAYSEGCTYLGYEINESQYDNLLKMKSWIPYNNSKIINDDCINFNLKTSTLSSKKNIGTFSCPPYINKNKDKPVEKYSEYGAENKSFSNYFKWLNEVIKKAPKPLGFQIPYWYIDNIPSPTKIIKMKKRKRNKNGIKKINSNDIIYIIE